MPTVKDKISRPSKPAPQADPFRNVRWGCQFYEGLVAKRSTDNYPVQLRSPRAEFVAWVKHRWAV